MACGKITGPDGQATANGEQPNDNDDSAGNPPSQPSRSDAGATDDDPPPQGNGGEMGCSASSVAGLSVTIGSPDFECNDFRVTATDADYEEQLACSVRDDRCRCFGAHERPGTYTVTVETGDPPIELAERQVVVEMDDEDCHVETESVSLRVVADEEDAGTPDAGGDPPGVADAGS